MRASYAKVTHDAKIRSQTAADKPGCSATLQAHRWSTTRCVSRDASRDRLGRALCVDARSILTFRVPDSSERIRCRHPASRVMHWPFLSDQRNLSGRSARASVCGTRNTRTSIYSRRNVVHWAHPQQRESGARHLGMATHKLPDSRPAVVSENARIAPPTLLPLTAPARSRRSCPGRCPPYAAHRKRLRRQPQSGQVCRYARPRLVEGRTRQLLERQPGLRSQRRRHRRHRLPAQRSRRSGVVDRALREGADQQSRGPGAAVGPGPVSSALPGWRRR